MKKFFTLLVALAVSATLIAGCSKAAAGPLQISLSKDGQACVSVITGYWAAFNKFNLDGAVACLDPAYAVTRTAGIQSELGQFQAGKSMGVQMVVYSVAQAGVLADGRLDLRITMKITPSGLAADRYLMYYMVKESDGSWKISKQGSDPDKSPPGSKADGITFTVVGPTEVDIVWVNHSTIATGVRVDRALDSSFQTEYVSVTLPADLGAASYKDTTVKPGVKYWYRIVPFNKAGDAPSQNWPVTTPAS